MTVLLISSHIAIYVTDTYKSHYRIYCIVQCKRVPRFFRAYSACSPIFADFKLLVARSSERTNKEKRR